MGTFDARTKTRTRVSIGKDAWKPNMGMLGPGSPEEDILIHGTRRIVIQKELLSTVMGSRTYMTLQNFSCTVVQNRTLMELKLSRTTLSNFTHIVIGPTNINYIGPSMYNFVAPLVEIHVSPRSLSEPAVRMEQVQQAIQNALDENWYGLTTKAAYAFKLEATGMSATTLFFGTELNGGKAVASLTEDQTLLFKDTKNPVDFSIQAVKNTVGALKTTTKTTIDVLKFAANSISF